MVTSADVIPTSSTRARRDTSVIGWVLIVLAVFGFAIAIFLLSSGTKTTQTTTTVDKSIEYYSCKATTDCVPGLKCINGTCQNTCETNVDCAEPGCPSVEDGGVSKYCSNGGCVLGKLPIGGACGCDTQCPEGSKCISGVCNYNCVNTSNCPSGTICQSGSCVEGTVGINQVCKYTSQCQVGLVCKPPEVGGFNTCKKPCTTDANCPGQYCDQLYYVCR